MTEKLTTSEKKVVEEEKEAEKVFQKESKSSPSPLSPDQLHRASQVLQSDSSSKLDEIKKILEEK